MLILSRRVGESVMIGNDVEVKVLAIKGRQIQLGIKAPESMTIDREEIAQRKERERQAAGA